jgi:hypothetical protein
MKHFIISLVFILFISCSKKQAIQDLNGFLVSNYSLPLDPNISPTSRAMQYLDGMLYWWNSERETISVFDLYKQEVINTIKLEREGPDGVGNSLGIYVHNKDSIYIPNFSYEIKLINSEGKLLNSYDYFNFSPLGAMPGSMSRYSLMFQEHQGKLIIWLDISSVNKASLTLNSLQEYPPFLALDMASGEFENLPFHFDGKILESRDFTSFSLSKAQDKLLALHRKSNLLYSFDLNDLKSQDLRLESEFVNNFSNQYYLTDRTGMSIEDGMRLLYRTSSNLGITFDPKRELIYRFGWPGEELSEDTDAMAFAYSPDYFVLSIYDSKDYKLLGEFSLPRNTYMAHHYFVDKNGLNLFPIHPDNPELKEDELKIHTFDFARLKQ